MAHDFTDEELHALSRGVIDRLHADFAEETLVNHWPVHPIAAEHFRAPVSGAHNFQTVPTLLRAIAAWLEERH